MKETKRIMNMELDFFTLVTLTENEVIIYDIFEVSITDKDKKSIFSRLLRFFKI